MINLKVIHLNQSNIVEEIKTIQTSHQINVIDKPFYVTSIKNDDNITFSFHFGHTREVTKKYSGVNFKLEYGTVSGRVYYISLPVTGLSETTYFNISSSLSQKFRSLRGQNNIRAYVELIKALTRQTESRPYAKAGHLKQVANGAAAEIKNE